MANSNINRDDLPLDDGWMTRLMEGRLSQEEEAMLSSNKEHDEMLGDAVEGLGRYDTIIQAQKQANNINRQLLEHLKNKPAPKKHPPMSLSTIVWIALVFILVLVVLGFYLIKAKGL